MRDSRQLPRDSLSSSRRFVVCQGHRKHKCASYLGHNYTVQLSPFRLAQSLPAYSQVSESVYFSLRSTDKLHLPL